VRFNFDRHEFYNEIYFKQADVSVRRPEHNGLNWSLCLNTFHTVGCGIWSSVRAITVDSRTSHGSFTKAINSPHANARPASVFTLSDIPFVYKLPIPTSGWVGFMRSFTTRRSETSSNSFRRSLLVKPQGTLYILNLRRHFPLIVIGTPLAAHML
jgi:hypothetical protein